MRAVTAAGMVAVAASVALGVAVPRPGPRPAYPTASCDEIARALDDVERGRTRDDHPRVVHVTVPWHQPGAGAVSCDGRALRTTGIFTPGGLSVLGENTTALLVRPARGGLLVVERACLGCDDVDSPPDPGFARRALRALGALLGVLGAAALLLAWKRRATPRLARVVGAAPTDAAWLAPGAADRVAAETLAGAAVALPDEVRARITLPASATTYREGPPKPPTLRGPARVNGLAVADGAETPLADGDVVRVAGAAPVVARFPGATWRLVRYHHAGDGHLRVIARTPPTRAAVLVNALAGAALAGSAVLVHLWPPHDGRPALALALVGVGAALAAPSLRGRYEARTIAHAPATTLRSRRDRGGDLVLDARGADSVTTTVEAIPPPAVFAPPDERALRRALEDEAAALAAAHRA